MRIMMLRLKGYLGINNGLLRNEITIDFSKSRHKICLIKGATGSGKTTILDSISPLPDDNSMLVPGQQAEKEIIYNNGIRIHILHPVNNRGERATTKAYIYDNDVNLNPNGNVTSFKDVVFNKLDLDSNFEALTKLSTRDRGLADKTPAIRKKYVANIISSVEVYNNIYKNLTKNSSTLKSMLQSIVAKMDSIGDEKSIDTNIKSIEKLLKQYEDKKEEISLANAAAIATVKALDPDGNIMMSYNTLTSEINTLNNNIASMLTVSNNYTTKYYNSNINNDINSIRQFYNITSKDIEDLSNNITSINISIKSKEESLNNLLNMNELENKNLNSKIEKLKNLTNDNNYEILCSNIKKVNKDISEIESFFKSINIKDALSLSSKEYEIGLNIIMNISDMLSNLFSIYTKDDINTVIINNIDFDKELNTITSIIEKCKIDKNNIMNEISKLKGQIEIYDSLSNRPKNCKIDDCPFISSALKIEENPRDAITRLEIDIVNIDSIIKDNEDKLDKLKIYKSCRLAINEIYKTISNNSYILEKLPGTESLCDINTFNNLLYSKDCWYNIIPDKDIIMNNLNKAYMFDSYKRLISERDKLNTQKQIFESKCSIIDEINNDINTIRSNINDISNKIVTIRNDVKENTIKYDNLTNKLNDLKTLNSSLSTVLEMIDKINDDTLKLSKLSSNIDKIKDSNATIYASKDTLVELNNAIKPMQDDLNRFKFNKQRLQEYKEELEVYKDRYEKTEVVKNYTSPTKEGIQLLFMDMYMHNILDTANKLLANVFNGQFMLQPFIINGDEFRIPCIGNRMMNDDISSMSNGQICMISMILSFSILFNSSSTYNILKLDEIDGGLDTESRTNFITVLNEIMNILGCEQCFLISHNEEIQYSSTDMILLRTNSDNSDYGNANIIFDINRM